MLIFLFLTCFVIALLLPFLVLTILVCSPPAQSSAQRVRVCACAAELDALREEVHELEQKKHSQDEWIEMAIVEKEKQLKELREDVKKEGCCLVGWLLCSKYVILFDFGLSLFLSVGLFICLFIFVCTCSVYLQTHLVIKAFSYIIAMSIYPHFHALSVIVSPTLDSLCHPHTPTTSSPAGVCPLREGLEEFTAHVLDPRMRECDAKRARERAWRCDERVSE